MATNTSTGPARALWRRCACWPKCCTASVARRLGPTDLCRGLLRQDVFDHLSRNAGETHVQALELHRQPLVIHTQQVQHGGVKIVNAYGVLFGCIAQLVSRAVSDPALHAAAGNHVGKAFDVMVAPVAAL